MKRFMTVVLALVTLGCVAHAPGAAATAQDSPDDLLQVLDGVESAYARKYLPVNDLGLASPVPADETTPSSLTVTVIEFAAEAQAADAFGSLVNPLGARMILGERDLDLDARPIDDLGDDATLFTGVESFSNGDRTTALLAVRDGNLGFLITAYGESGAIGRTVVDFATFMVDAGPVTAPVVVSEHGATGGTFDLMPSRGDDDVLHGLFPMYEYDLLTNGQEPIEHHATPTSRQSRGTERM